MLPASRFGFGDAFEESNALAGGFAPDTEERRRVFIDRTGEIIRGQMEIADSLMLPHSFLQRKVRMSQIGGDRSLHF